MIDEYKSIAVAAEGLYKEKGSKFIAYAYPSTSENEVQKNLGIVKSLHPKARHHCYAYRIGLEGEQWRANDDGEPSGTAGKPIHGQLVKHNLTNVLIVVVRYFGGTLLGASGLIRSYKLAALDAIQSAEIVTHVVSDTYRISFAYNAMGDVMSAIERQQLAIKDTSFDESPHLDIAVRLSKAEDLLLALRAAIHNVSEEQVAEMNDGPGWKIKRVE